ncbi:MAG: hypothetical protein P8X82_11340 [Gemmatimonadales bacterium]
MGILMHPPAYPANRSEASSEWLIETLNRHLAFAQDPLESATLHHMGDGVGQLSTLIRADLSRASGTPTQVVVKLHTAVPEMHAIALRYGHYESEVNFYRYLADEIPMRTPEVFVAGLEPDTGHVAIIMESFNGWHSPNPWRATTSPVPTRPWSASAAFGRRARRMPPEISAVDSIG